MPVTFSGLADRARRSSFGFTVASVLAFASSLAIASGPDMRRCAVHQDTIVASLESNGLSAVMTFVKDRFTYVELYVLSKVMFEVKLEGTWVSQIEAESVAVEDLPGGVRAVYRFGSTTVTAELMPLQVGRSTPAQDGAAVLEIRSEPATALRLSLGGSAIEHPMTNTWPIAETDMGAKGDKVTVEDGMASISTDVHPLSVVIMGDAAPTVATSGGGGQYVRYGFADGRGRVLVAYADEPAEAKRIARMDAAWGQQALAAYFDELLKCRVDTPVAEINNAFRGALITLEYAWNVPYGWVESVNLWHALWHMQHTAGEEWIGHADRSRLSNMTHAENLMTDGAVPQFMTYLHKRRDFGGSNQFFAWQVRHYLQFTGDREFAETLGPVMDRVLKHTYEENDPDGNGLLGWGLQIGNQEDYIATPYDGTTPTIEGINMWRTRQELARAVGDETTAAQCQGRIEQIAGRMRAALWRSDLGRYAFFEDPLGVPRLDGQYHTLIYPGLWGMADPLDNWTSLRHMKDRLMGRGGEVYCSNNFPTHTIATVGTQAGAAQQPWAAWGLSAAGLRNETWRPLAAVARWVMDDNHRGAWPEISKEPRPAYFSPPAGLFIAATVEALFGLHVNKPAGELAVSPSFPDDWDSASVTLPEYSATYRRKGNEVEYVVHSQHPLARCVRWSLPPVESVAVSVDGENVEFTLEPGVDCVFMTLRTKLTTETRILIRYEPLDVSIAKPGSIAQGDPIEVRLTGAVVRSVEDRGGVLGSVSIDHDSVVRGRIGSSLLEAYAGYGRLGQLICSRRTFFLECEGRSGARWWSPVDVAILPRYEVAPVGELRGVGNALEARLLVRNNTQVPLRGTGWLHAAQRDFDVALHVSARSEQEVRVAIPSSFASLLAPGDNAATLTLGDGTVASTVLVANAAFANEPLGSYQRSRMEPISLPAADVVPDTEWGSTRPFQAYGHMPWAGSRPPLEALGDAGELVIPDVPGLKFEFTARRFVPVSHPIGRPSWTLPLKGRTCAKLYLLVLPFLDNHDMFSPVARIVVEGTNGAAFSRLLHFPGDLDWWSPPAVVGVFSTARETRPNRFGLLPIRSPEQGDWDEGRAPAFPQPKFWAGCRSVVTESTVLNVVEVDLGRPVSLERLMVTTLGAQAGLGVVAVVAAEMGDMTLLAGSGYMPQPAYRPPRLIFDFQGEDVLEGWKLEGEAFSVAPVRALFAFPTLNSLAKGGEPATGRATSPAFDVAEGERWLEIELQGGRSATVDGEPNLCVRVLDAQTGDVVGELLPAGSHAISPQRLDVGSLGNRSIRLELVDRNADTSYAWIGIRRLWLRTE